MDRSTYISSAGVVIYTLGQVAALGHRGPELPGETPSPFAHPGSPKLPNVTDLGWMESLCESVSESWNLFAFRT